MSSDTHKIVELIESDLNYMPNWQQRRLKSAFWTRWRDNPLVDPTRLSLNAVQAVVGDSRLDRWWREPGFKQWFTNQEEWREEAESLVFTALDTLRNIMTDDRAPAAARVAASVKMLELARKMPSKADTVPANQVEKKIAQMSKEELIEYIRANTLKLIEPTSSSTEEVN